MKTFTKIICTFILATILIILVYINSKLYYQPEIKVVKGSRINNDLIHQLEFLKLQKRQHADDEMQKLYPEGQVFFNALYGLAWCEIADTVSRSSLYEEAHQEISKACISIQSEKAKSTFEELLSLPYGAFYNGWSNYLLGRKLGTEPHHQRKQKEIEAFKSSCEKIKDIINDKETPYPVSYYGGAWPADAMICIASLALHDRLFTPRYQDDIATWLDKIKSNLDPNGLIPHAVHPETGKPTEDARGSSQSLMLIFLLEIDPEFAKKQFHIYKEKFLAHRLGLPGIREYPKGGYGMGDIDSGPVVLQIGAAASIVGIRTMSLFGEYSISKGLRNGIEAFAFPTESGNTKKYLLGQLPIADAFIAWADAGKIKVTEETIDTSWRNRFHWYSVLIAIPLIALIVVIWTVKFRKKSKLIVDW